MTGLLVAKLFVSMTCPALPRGITIWGRAMRTRDIQLHHPRQVPMPSGLSFDACKMASPPHPLNFPELQGAWELLVTAH